MRLRPARGCAVAQREADQLNVHIAHLVAPPGSNADHQHLTDRTPESTGRQREARSSTRGTAYRYRDSKPPDEAG